MTQTTVVIDASIAVKWFAPHPDSEQAYSLIDRFEFAAPWLIHAEASNAFWLYVRAGNMTLEAAKDALAGIAGLVDAVTDPALTARALELSARHSHPVYDMSYVALAETMNAPLLTADRRLKRLCDEAELAQALDMASL